jgi:hypothetical protein
MVRTPEEANKWLVPAMIAKRADSVRPTTEDVREYLRDVHLGVEPTSREVKGAHGYVSTVLAKGLPTKSQTLSLLFDIAVKVAPRLEEMNWTVEDCAEPLLATCDRLPAMWRTPSDEDGYQGVGIEGAESYGSRSTRTTFSSSRTPATRVGPRCSPTALDS